jgi:hypothetical protein
MIEQLRARSAHARCAVALAVTTVTRCARCARAQSNTRAHGCCSGDARTGMHLAESRSDPAVERDASAAGRRPQSEEHPMKTTLETFSKRTILAIGIGLACAMPAAAQTSGGGGSSTDSSATASGGGTGGTAGATADSTAAS